MVIYCNQRNKFKIGGTDMDEWKERNESYAIPGRAELKNTAKQFMRGKDPSPWLVVLVAIGLQNVLSMLQMQVTGLARVMPQLLTAMERYAASGDSDIFLEAYFTAIASARPGVGGTLIAILLGLASLMLTTGLLLFYIETVRTRKGSFGNLLDGLTKLPRVIGYNIMVGIFVIGWMIPVYLVTTLLSIFSILTESIALALLTQAVGLIGGVVTAMLLMIRYSQGMYFLLTRPEVGILDCITLSKQIMKPRKGEYFMLLLSFLGWSLGLYFVNMGLSVLGIFGVILSLPLSAFVQMYQGFTYFLYHEAIQGRTYDPTQPPAPELPGEPGGPEDDNRF
jgi:uncharacterized membrane protein